MNDFFGRIRVSHSTILRKCTLCNQMIKPSEVYVRQFTIYEDTKTDFQWHVDCKILIDNFCNEYNESEYTLDYINEWLADKYCYCCKKQHSCDCPDYPISCEGILHTEYLQREGKKYDKL